jgi:flavodoxin
MKTLILYDSVYGNTEQIAGAIGQAICNAPGSQEVVAILKASDVRPEQFAGLDLLIVGSPTQRFRSLPVISSLLNSLSKNSLEGVKVTAFDTRLTKSRIEETPILAFFVRLFGRAAYAAGPMADQLKKKGGKLVVSPEGFYVEGMEGPLVEGELERAASWARQILARTH